jgi:uncharacterized membrane protein YfcA
LRPLGRSGKSARLMAGADGGARMITDPWFYAAGVAAVLLVGISKGGFGGATGLMGVPLMALFVAPTTAAAIMLPLLCAMDVLALRAYWGLWDRRRLLVLIPAGLVGIAVGAATFGLMNENAIRLLIGILAILFAANAVLRELRPAGAVARERPLSGPFWGTVSGFTSFVSHAGGPPLTVHMLALGLEKSVYQATTVGFYAAINAAKLLPYAGLGLFDGSALASSLVLAPAAPLGIWLGMRLHRLVDARWFYRIIMAGLAATGVKLVADALAAG